MVNNNAQQFAPINHCSSPDTKSRLYCYETLDEETPNPTVTISEQTAVSSHPQNQIVPGSVIWYQINKSQEMQAAEDTSTTDEVQLVTLNEFKEFLTTNINTPHTEKLNKLADLFTYIPQSLTTGYWNLWLEVPTAADPVYLDMTIEKAEYFSQCFFYEKSNQKTPDHIFINAYHENDQDKFYFQIRLDADVGEIIHIQKGDSISGTEIKKICLDLLNFFRPSTVYLHDDAKIDQTSMNLRVYLPVASLVPETWYSKDGFRILNCSQILNPNGSDRPPQDENRFHSSVNCVRGYLLNFLFPQMPIATPFPDQRKVGDWLKFYFRDGSKTLQNTTVHELANQMYVSSRNTTNQLLSKKAEADFAEFYQAFLSKAQPFFPVDYQESLIVLHAYQLWYKQYN